MKIPTGYLTFLAFLLAATLRAEPASPAAPGLADAVVLIIRHAEKPESGFELSAAGQKRAEAYINYFNNFTIDSQPCRPDYLVATADSKGSHRPRLTLEPLSRATGLKIDVRFKDKEFPLLADELKTNRHGDHILIAWHHGAIPGLLHALGAEPGTLLPGGKWPEDVFHWVIELRFDHAGQLIAAQSKRINERLMPGDAERSVSAGVDRDVVLGGKTWLAGSVGNLESGEPAPVVLWSKDSGPGEVTFADASSLKTTATFSTPGQYSLKLAAGSGNAMACSMLKVNVIAPPPPDRLDVVYTKRYQIDSPLWNARAKSLIVNWIPHCVDQINRTNLAEGQGGIDNFIEAAKALRGEPHGPQKGYVFANAWVHQTVESMCLALMIDPRGDPEIIRAQAGMQATLADWIPKILAAQEPDGYLQTAWTLRDTNRWHERWSPEGRGNHEGYTAGYFIESAINHYTLTGGADRRLYDAAKKLADCWAANLGPGKKEWYDGHEEMEQALVRFGRFVNDMEGGGHGDRYIALAKFLLDSRHGDGPYDQSQSPVQQQYEAVGHAVRAAYCYSGMADIAAETHDLDYQSAVMSLWDDLINRKYYVTGGIGSGETSEGFGPDYSLRNEAYCESCSSCGLIFFQYKLNLAYHDARYADLYEETFYNALLGATDLEGRTFFYDNPLIDGHRGEWHVCPCCVGNIPRTLLMIPTWTYAKGADGIYVNLFIGGTVQVGRVAGADLEMVQKTDYPWSGKIAITVNPKAAREFTVHVRVPDRSTSALYSPTPKVSGLKSLAVNGKPLAPRIEKGYAAITRKWERGDQIDLELPMEIQRVKADEHIAADRGLVALRYGPLIYNVERADQPTIDQPMGAAPLTLEWRGDLLGGVMVIKGQWADGSPLLAIPNYARNNRLDASPARPNSIVWMKDAAKPVEER